MSQEATGWSTGTLTFGSAILQRFDKAGLLSVPEVYFVLRVKGAVVLGGEIVSALSPRQIQHPVLVYQPMGSKGQETVTLKLLPTFNLRDTTRRLPGLTDSTEQAIHDTLSALPTPAP